MNKFVIALLVAACFVATATAKKGDKPEPKNDNVPVLTKGKSMIIKGEKNNLISNDVVLYPDEHYFRKGDLNVELNKDGKLYVNSKLVLKQDPSAPVITKNPKLKAKKIVSFEIKIDEQGQVTYVLKTSI